MDTRATISDLFPWRVDDTWETRFELMNLPSLLDPGKGINDEVTLVLFDSDGIEMSRHVFDMQGEVCRPVDISELIGKSSGLGTFCVFHASDALVPDIAENGAYLTERNYLAFRRKGDALWNYLHGNTNALSKPLDRDALGYLAGHGRSVYRYRPQLRFDDCKCLEMFYVNPTQKTAAVSVTGFDEERRITFQKQETVPPRGIRTIKFTTTETPVTLIEAEGSIEDWRPVLIKHFDTHFDALHS